MTVLRVIHVLGATESMSSRLPFKLGDCIGALENGSRVEGIDEESAKLIADAVKKV